MNDISVGAKTFGNQDCKYDPSYEVLKLEDFGIDFYLHGRVHPAVRHLNLSIHAGEIVGLVGESSCGKTVTAKACIGLLPDTAKVTRGKLLIDGKEMSTADERKWNKLRGKDVAMIFQDPLSALNPLHKIGKQVAENIKERMSRSERKNRTMAMLKEVGLPDVESIYQAYPFQLSGGMRQRVVIALALINNPSLLLADEPTTALDVTTQAQILQLLYSLSHKHNTSVLFISHDLGLINQFCRRVYVMYSGVIVEDGMVASVLQKPLHPYTKAMLASLPTIAKRHVDLPTIPGMMLPLEERATQLCPFVNRCLVAESVCSSVYPHYHQAPSTDNSGDIHRYLCHIQGGKP